MKKKEKKEKNKKIYDDDDGRVIARMDYDYIPWYARKPKQIKRDDVPPLSRKETFRIMMSALAAGLVIGLIFMAFYALIFLVLILLWT